MYAGRRASAAGAAGIVNVKFAVKVPAAAGAVPGPAEEPPPPQPANATNAINAGAANQLRYADIPEVVNDAPRKTSALFTVVRYLSLVKSSDGGIRGLTR